jgi:hypothetical protein
MSDGVKSSIDLCSEHNNDCIEYFYEPIRRQAQAQLDALRKKILAELERMRGFA